jgi:hypothetical protein
VTEQEPEERMQDEVENFPIPLVVHVTVPVGEAPVTVAVHLDAIVTITGEVAQVTDVVAMLGAKLSPNSAHPSLVCEYPKGKVVELLLFPQTWYSLPCHPPTPPHE